MPQYAVPNADTTPGNWEDQGGSSTDMHDDIAPGTPGSIGSGDDSTYIESETAPSSSPVVFELSDPEDPQSSSGHVLRWRRAKSAAGGAQIDLTVELRQGYTGEGSQGTQITSQSDNDVSDGFATESYTLSGAEADSITDYSDLQVRIVANQP